TFQLSRTLDINVEYEVLALRPGLLQHLPVRPVIIAEYLGPLEELATVDHGLKLSPRDEVIALPVRFGASPHAAGIGNREHQVRHVPNQMRHQSRFSRPRGRRNDENRGHLGIIAETQKRRPTGAWKAWHMAPRGVQRGTRCRSPPSRR